MDNKKIIDNISESAKQDTEFAREWRIKFFFHWSLLSGAAITLFIPFLSSDVVQTNITKCSILYVQITFVSFIVSMLFSSIRNFMIIRDILKLGQAKHEIVNKITAGLKEGETLETPKPIKITEIFGYIAILAFVTGTISAYIFISQVIF